MPPSVDRSKPVNHARCMQTMCCMLCSGTSIFSRVWHCWKTAVVSASRHCCTV